MRTEKGKKSIIAAGILSAAMVFQTIPVWGAQGAVLSMEEENYNEAERTLEISCMLENGTDITNGKIRIYYDQEKVQLKETQAGKSLEGAMTEINDCLSGNKEEGELVSAFASSENIPENGSLLDLKLQLLEGVENGDKISFEIKAEKLAGDNGDVEVTVQDGTYIVGEGIEHHPSEDPAGDKDSDEDQKENGSNGSGSKDEGGNKGSSNQSSGNVKTGDDSQPILYAVGCAAGLAVLGGIFVTRKNRKKMK